MAAGMGSRFGGLKQLAGFGPHGETLLEYSLYDAKQAGFNRAVFVIRPDMEALFQGTVLSRFSHALPCTYAFQTLDDLPPGYEVPAGRTRPWGTAHAVWAARAKIHGPFAVINADDYYGQTAFPALADFLRPTTQHPSSDAHYALCGYRLRQTLSAHGSVSRGLCLLDDSGKLLSVTEHPRINADGHGGGLSEQPDGPLPLSGDALVSMNLWGFTNRFLEALDRHFAQFIENLLGQPSSPSTASRLDATDDFGAPPAEPLRPMAAETILRAECYLPSVVDAELRSGRAQVTVLPTESRWFGVTYPEDRQPVAQGIHDLVASGAYPSQLWPRE